jgi:cytochrome d ubiquinol oxidase subunit I
MLFGWKKVGPKMHFFATIMVAFAASLSAFWILAANSWMQTPSGGHIENGLFVVDNYLAAIFSPDLPLAFSHMYLACLEVSLFVIGAGSGVYVLCGRHVAFFLKSFKLAALAAILVAPLQALVGDLNGQEIGRLQPAKVAAIESHWETNKPGEPAAWNMLAWPDPENERNLFEIPVPYGLSLLITHSLTGQVKGLKDFPRQDRPPIVIPFYSFRLMVGIGFAMVGVMLWTLWEWKKGRLAPAAGPGPKLLYLAWAAMAGGSYLAVILGWVTREVGRQPWLLYGLIRTGDGASKLPAGHVGLSLIGFAVAYTVLFLVVCVLHGQAPAPRSRPERRTPGSASVGGGECGGVTLPAAWRVPLLDHPQRGRGGTWANADGAVRSLDGLQRQPPHSGERWLTWTDKRVSLRPGTGYWPFCCTFIS